MDKRLAYLTVFEDLINIPLFKGIYNAKNGKEIYMYGINAVMEYIAYNIDENFGDTFSEIFINNLIASEGRAEKGEKIKWSLNILQTMKLQFQILMML